MTEEEKINKWISEHDGDDYCHYCTLSEDCSHGMVCYGGEPIESACCAYDIAELLNTEQILEDMDNGEE